MKKNRIIAITLLAMLGTTVFVACKKESSSQTTTNSRMTIKSSTRECLTLNFVEVNIGQLHNDGIKKVYEGLDFKDPVAARAKIINNFEAINYDPTTLGITREQFNSETRSIISELEANNYDIRNYTDASITSAASYPYLVNIMNEIEGLVDLTELNQSLDVIENQVNANLTCTDKDVVLATIKIARSSAQLWLPTNLGGEGYYDQVVLMKGGKTSAAQRLITNAIIADASSLSASFLKWGAMLAVGLEVPGANMAILVGLATDALLGSAMSLFF